MRVYISTRVAKGVRIGTSAKLKDVLLGYLILFGLLLALVFWLVEQAVMYWWVSIPVLIGGGIGAWQLKKRRDEERITQYQQVMFLDTVPKLEKALNLIEEGKSISTKVNNCEKAIQLIDEIDTYDRVADLLENRQQIKAKLQAFRKLLPIVDKLERSEKQRFLGKQKMELRYLVEALYEARKTGVTDNDFKLLEIANEETNEMWSLSHIERRARELGWEGSHLNN